MYFYPNSWNPEFQTKAFKMVTMYLSDLIPNYTMTKL